MVGWEPQTLIDFLKEFFKVGSIKVASKESGDIIILFESDKYLPFTLKFNREQYTSFCNFLATDEFLYRKFYEASCEPVINQALTELVFEYQTNGRNYSG